MNAQRPVFEGDWAKASGHERQAHMQAVAAWKKETGASVAPREAKAQTRMDADVAPLDRHADDLATLESVIGSSKALNSDRIRAIETKQRILAKVYAEQLAEEHGPLIELRSVLDLLPPAERVAALSGLLAVG